MKPETQIENSNTLSSRNDEVRAELKAIEARKAGLNPSTVLNVAKNPKSCLHRYFCWDDTEAARRYREQQAYELIRTIKTTITTHDNREVTVRAFFPVKQVEADGTIDHSKRGNYISTEQIVTNEEAMRQIIDRAKSEMIAFSTKYRSLASLAEFSEVFDAISRAVKPALN